ncbi:MAG: GTP pyrophosphokinase family protein [Thomasclavelia sp.]|nr:GTP pyrophosphokinase family protein [Thomasclavelia sp.]
MAKEIMQKEIKEESMEFVFDNKELFKEYQTMIQQYQAGIKEVRTKLEILDDEFNIRYNHNPIHHMEYRLKSPDSIKKKLDAKNLSFSTENISNNLYDIAGIRVICNYVKDIYRISKLLTKQDDVTVIEKKDYIKNPKPNGYASLHLVIEVPIFLSDRTKTIPVEVQIRTIAMDFWASLEHQLRYKNQNELPSDIKERLVECARKIYDLDEQMEEIHTILKGNHQI